MNGRKILVEKMNRRRFLQRLTLLGAGLAAACASKEQAGAPTPFRTITPERALIGPQIPVSGGQAEGTPTASAAAQGQAGSLSLDKFLQLSSLLTGIENLDPALGQVYLQALQSDGTSGSELSGAYSAASSGSKTLPKDTESLTSSGFFEQKGMSDLAVHITDMWYSGIYSLNGEDHVATYVDALAWKVLHFTKEPTICGYFGIWATEPNVQISPSVQYTPVPTPAQ